MESNKEPSEKKGQFRLNRRKLALRDLSKVFLVIFCGFVFGYSWRGVIWLLDHYVGREDLRQLEPYTWAHTLYRSLLLMPLLLSFVIYYRGSILIDRVPIDLPFNRRLCLLSIASSTALIAWPALALDDITSYGRVFAAWPWLIWWGLYFVSALLYFRSRKGSLVRRRQRHLRILKPALILALFLFLAYSAAPNY